MLRLRLEVFVGCPDVTDMMSSFCQSVKLCSVEAAHLCLLIPKLRLFLLIM